MAYRVRTNGRGAWHRTKGCLAAAATTTATAIPTVFRVLAQQAIDGLELADILDGRRCYDRLLRCVILVVPELSHGHVGAIATGGAFRTVAARGALHRRAVGPRATVHRATVSTRRAIQRCGPPLRTRPTIVARRAIFAGSPVFTRGAVFARCAVIPETTLRAIRRCRPVGANRTVRKTIRARTTVVTLRAFH